MCNKIKNEKGITGIDIAISIFIIIVFSSFIATIFYNIAIVNSSKKRNAMASLYATEILEEIGMMNYDDITNEKLEAHFTKKYTAEKNVNIASNTDTATDSNHEVNGYTISMDVTNYKDTEGNSEKEDFIKTTKVKVEYKIGNNVDFVEISRVNTKEI